MYRAIAVTNARLARCAGSRGYALGLFVELLQAQIARARPLAQTMSIADHLPDACFDILARFVPGAIIVAECWWYFDIGLPDSGTRETGILIGVSYLVGHILQPIGSAAARASITLVWWRPSPMCIFRSGRRKAAARWSRWNLRSYSQIKGIAKPLGRNSLLVEKAYAEAAGFFSICAVNLAFCLVGTPYGRPLWSFFLFAALGFDRSCAYVRKLTDVVRIEEMKR